MKIKQAKEKIEIFEADTFKEALQNCLDEGYVPQTLNQVVKLCRNGLIKEGWYNTTSVLDRNLGKVRDLTKGELKDLNNTFNKTGLSSMTLDGYSVLTAYWGDLADSSGDGRVVGVKK
ncbi:MAG: hypothetical protein AABY22_27135 [Nanoarchaeota archaeon]|mgnify:CR=1 FL=1